MKLARRRALRFLSVYVALVREIFRFSPGRAVFVAGCQIVGPFMQSCIVLLLHRGIGFVSGKRSLPHLPFVQEGQVIEPTLLIGGLSLLILILGAGGAALGWVGTAGASSLGRRYRLYATGRDLEIVSTLPVGSMKLPGPLADSSALFRIAASYGLKMNLAVVGIFGTLRQLVLTMGLVGSLFLVNPKFAGVVLAIVPVILPLLYWLHVKTLKSSRKWFMEGGAKETTSLIGDFVFEANRLPETRESVVKPVKAEQLEKHPAIAANLFEFENGRLGAARTQLYNGVFGALLLGIGLFALGVHALKAPNFSWDGIVVFLVAVAMAQRSAASLMSSASNLVWLSPMIASGADFRRQLVQAQKEAPMEVPEPAEEGKSMLRRGARVLVVSPVRLGRTSFHFHLRQLQRSRIVTKAPCVLRYRHWSFGDTSKLNEAGNADALLISFNARKQKEDALLNALEGPDFPVTIVFAETWRRGPEGFDYLIRRDEDGQVLEGDSEWWRGREGLERELGKGEEITIEEDLS